MAFVYLDHAATTPLDPRVREAMLPWLGERFGNPSSRHKPGVAAAQAIEAARASVARAIGARRDEVVFTSGGTEANALAVLGGARARREKGRHVLVGPAEHACVRESALALAREGFEVETLRLDARGALDLEHAAGRMRADTVLVAQMLVQNEVGTIYPVRELARAVRARSKHALVHVDAVQALGKVPVELAGANAPRVDYASFSAHKLHGPKGAGALWVRPGSPFTPRQRGGAQEQGRRAGTENLPALVGFGRAAELARAWLAGPGPAALAALRDRFEVELVRRAGPVRLHARGARRLPNTTNLAFDGLDAEALLAGLSSAGLLASAGSACHAGARKPSHVLAALGLPPAEAAGTVRFSLGRGTTPAEVEAGLDLVVDTVRALRAG